MHCQVLSENFTQTSIDIRDIFVLNRCKTFFLLFRGHDLVFGWPVCCVYMYVDMRCMFMHIHVRASAKHVSFGI
jgi:hypothetical protein